MGPTSAFGSQTKTEASHIRNDHRQRRASAFTEVRSGLSGSNVTVRGLQRCMGSVPSTLERKTVNGGETLQRIL